jgi:hypothetical protein
MKVQVWRAGMPRRRLAELGKLCFAAGAGAEAGGASPGFGAERAVAETLLQAAMVAGVSECKRSGAEMNSA